MCTNKIKGGNTVGLMSARKEEIWISRSRVIFEQLHPVLWLVFQPLVLESHKRTSRHFWILLHLSWSFLLEKGWNERLPVSLKTYIPQSHWHLLRQLLFHQLRLFSSEEFLLLFGEQVQGLNTWIYSYKHTQTAGGIFCLFVCATCETVTGEPVFLIQV